MAKQKKRGAKTTVTSPVVEALEPRILLSADLPGLDIAMPSFDQAAEPDADQILANVEAVFEAQAADNDSQLVDEAPAETDQQAIPAIDNDAHSERHELVIVDGSVPDQTTLLSAIEERLGDGTIVDVITLDADQDGVEQITRVLFQYADLDAIHLVSHGSDGRLQLGNSVLDAEALVDKEDFIASWGSALIETVTS